MVRDERIISNSFTPNSSLKNNNETPVLSDDLTNTINGVDAEKLFDELGKLNDYLESYVPYYQDANNKIVEKQQSLSEPEISFSQKPQEPKL